MCLSNVCGCKIFGNGVLEPSLMACGHIRLMSKAGSISVDLETARQFLADLGVIVCLATNDQRNRDAHERCPISIRVVCGSGSRDCSAASVGAGQ